MCLRITWILLLLLIIAHPSFTEVPLGQFFPFGSSNGDSRIQTSSATYAYTQFSFVFFKKKYTSLYVDSNGTIRFGFYGDLREMCSTRRSFRDPSIAPFWSPVDWSHIPWYTYYRESTDPVLLSKARSDILKGFLYLETLSLSLKSVFIVTYDKVEAYHYPKCPKDGLTNTFQAILTTDGVLSFVIFYYNELSWSLFWDYDHDHHTGCFRSDKRPAAAGFTGGIGYPFQDVLGNCTADVLQLTKLSNVDEAGKWVFRVDEGIEHPSLRDERESTTTELITKIHAENEDDLKQTNKAPPLISLLQRLTLTIIIFFKFV